jgi:hypothetical protein
VSVAREIDRKAGAIEEECLELTDVGIALDDEDDRATTFG